MDYQTFMNLRVIIPIIELIVTFVVVIGYLISSGTHADTVSWNG